MPTLVMVGEVDEPNEVAVGRHLAASVEGAELVDSPGVAHMIHTEEPERFMQLTLVGMANHRREGFVGALGALIEGLGEAAPSSSPFDRGEEDEVSRRLGPAASTIRITPRAHVWTFASLDEGWACGSGPTGR